MNAVDRVLNDEVTRLMDRLAAALPAGALVEVSLKSPALRRRMDEADAQLCAARAALVDAYGRWGRALEDVENLWALAAWRSATEEAAEPPTAVAA